MCKVRDMLEQYKLVKCVIQPHLKWSVNNSCLTNEEKKKKSEKLKPCRLSHLCTAEQSQHEVGVNVGWLVS